MRRRHLLIFRQSFLGKDGVLRMQTRYGIFAKTNPPGRDKRSVSEYNKGLAVAHIQEKRMGVSIRVMFALELQAHLLPIALQLFVGEHVVPNHRGLHRLG